MGTIVCTAHFTTSAYTTGRSESKDYYKIDFKNILARPSTFKDRSSKSGPAISQFRQPGAAS